MTKQAYHGGEFFEAVGVDFSDLKNHQKIVSSDVLDSWFEPSPKILKKIRQYLPYILKTSPPTHSEGLIEIISKYRQIPSDHVIVAGGSSDIIYTFFPNMIGKNQKVLILDPMYGEYAHILERVIKTKVSRFILRKENGFKLDTKELLVDVKRRRPHMIVLVNPNSPTGQYLPKSDLIKFIKSVPKKILVVIDETYIEYIGSEFSLEREVVNIRNLVIIKSMSKAYGLSGARVGYLVASPSLIEKIAPFVPPWSVNLIGQIAGVEALKDSKYYQQQYRKTTVLRENLAKALRGITGLKIYPSTANFLLVELLNKRTTADSVVKKLKKYNIFIRNCDSMSFRFRGRFIRIAVKDARINKKIFDAIKKAL